MEGDVGALNKKTASHGILSFCISMLFILMIFFSPKGTATDITDSSADAQFTLTFISGTMIDVTILMDAHRLTTDKTYTAQDIAHATDEERGALKYELYLLLKGQLDDIFKNSERTNFSLPSYTNGYFYETLTINLTSTFFGLNDSIDVKNFINGLLDMGANITYNFNLKATSGWNNTFTFILPSSIALGYANTTQVNQDYTEITWILRNGDGKTPMMQATLRTYLKNPTTHSSESEDISLELILDTRPINRASFTSAFVAKTININKYNIVLPSFITDLGSIPADGVRLFIENGLFSWSDVFNKTIQPIEQRTTLLIENSSFNQTLDLSFSWDPTSTTNCSTPYNISHMDNDPAIQANYNDSNISLQICQMPTRVFFGLMNAGGTASISSTDMNFGEGFEGVVYPYDILLYLPENIYLNDKNLYIWNKTTPITGVFTSQVEPTPPYTKERIETYIEIDLLKMDLNIPSVFTGKTELIASAKMKEDDRLYVISRTSELFFSPKVNITYLNADAFRLCSEENVFTDTQINSFLSQKTEASQQRLSEIFHGIPFKCTIDQKLFANSLVWDKDISLMDDAAPVVVSNYANQVYAVGFNVSLWPAEMTLTPQRFTLSGLENQTVTYRIIFPRGIAVNASESAGKPLITGKTNDGRDYVELSYDTESITQSTVLTCTLNVSPIYILGLFLPCVLVLILLIVLIVIIYLIRKKRGGFRRGKRKIFEPEDNEPSDYSGENYYVPLPPSSSKKK